jgi:hypothetical protein
MLALTQQSVVPVLFAIRRGTNADDARKRRKNARSIKTVALATVRKMHGNPHEKANAHNVNKNIRVINQCS